MPNHNPEAGAPRWLARISSTVFVTALLATGLAAPSGALRPASDSAGCVDAPADSARVKPGNLGEEPNEVTAAKAAALQRATLVQLSRMNLGARALQRTGPIRIAVRWHVITRASGAGNVTNAQLARQLEVLNDGFGGSTAPAAVDTPFRFFTASIDRTRNNDWYNWGDPDTDPSDNRDAKLALRIRPQKELNVYIANLADGLLGYATFPNDGRIALQGVVLLNESLPGGDAAPYNEGDTGTHEVGHWLGLFHTFQNSCDLPGDYVADTPYQFAGNNIFFCRANDDTCPQPGTDPVRNFMSYGTDPCLNQFTAGQSRRMVAEWTAWRSPNVG